MNAKGPFPRFPLRSHAPDDGPLPLLRPRLRRSDSKAAPSPSEESPRPAIRVPLPHIPPAPPSLLDHLLDLFLRSVRFAWRLALHVLRVLRFRVRRSSRRPSLALV